MKGYTLFRRNRPGRHSGGIALLVQQHLKCIEICLGVDDEQAESLRIRIKHQTSKGEIAVGVCYRPPEQEDKVDKAFYRQLEVALKK